ncbi:hypothetical protein C7Y71_009825 [Pseudoprevotella muciniphila]|uniref:Uncharacterized protein n=1 Tax=Pseudoprevotella muciniphila TaxID=2133944 RepID=A0A5P8E8R2_9BACT|nr:hypothetical protein C7Y71_009825 [Pseudoprevotella muciniphila]
MLLLPQKRRERDTLMGGWERNVMSGEKQKSPVLIRLRDEVLLIPAISIDCSTKVQLSAETRKRKGFYFRAI